MLGNTIKIISLLISSLLFCSLAKATDIVVAARYDNEPLSFEDDTEMQGIAFEVFSEILQELQLPYQIKKAGPLPWKRVMLYLKNNKIDVFLGSEKLNGQSSGLVFSKYPLYQTSYSAFYRKDDSLDITQLKKSLGAVLNDVNPSVLTSGLGAQLHLSESYTREQNLLKLFNKRVDYFLAPLLPTLNFISSKRKNERQKIAFIKEPVAVAANYLVYSPESPLLAHKDQIDQKLLQLQKEKRVEARIGEVISTWDAFDWYLQHFTESSP